MEMEFTVLERIYLGQILPLEGDFTAVKIIRRLQEEISLDEADRKEINFHYVEEKDPDTGEMVRTGQARWDEDATLVKNIEIGDFANAIIVEALEKLSNEGHLRLEHGDLYERFVEDKNA